MRKLSHLLILAAAQFSPRLRTAARRSRSRNPVIRAQDRGSILGTILAFLHLHRYCTTPAPLPPGDRGVVQALGGPSVHLHETDGRAPAAPFGCRRPARLDRAPSFLPTLSPGALPLTT